MPGEITEADERVLLWIARVEYCRKAYEWLYAGVIAGGLFFGLHTIWCIVDGDPFPPWVLTTAALTQTALFILWRLSQRIGRKAVMHLFAATNLACGLPPCGEPGCSNCADYKPPD